MSISLAQLIVWLIVGAIAGALAGMVVHGKTRGAWALAGPRRRADRRLDRWRDLPPVQSLARSRVGVDFAPRHRRRVHRLIDFLLVLWIVRTRGAA